MHIDKKVYDFEQMIDRKGTYSVKYDNVKKNNMPDGIIPLWIADMDFKSPDCVIEAMKNRVEHGVFGYTDSKQSYIEAIQNWYLKYFDWKIDSEWLVEVPGVVVAICTAIRSLTEKGDGILIQQPVYYPFAESIANNERKIIVNQLIYSEGKYSIDFSNFERKIIDNNVKLFIICSPHNPVGRLWEEEELIQMGDICLKHGVIVISDEIHADFTYPGYKHKVFYTVKKEFEDIAIICTAPSKTFNIAGLQTSNIFIKNIDIRNKFIKEIESAGMYGDNIFGPVACQAAYEGGEEWLNQLKEHLLGNLDFVRDFLKQRIPQVKLVEPQATYLLWLDFSELGFSDEELDKFMVEKAGLWLDGGSMFGNGGEGFQRFNIACSREILEKAFVQLEKAINSL